MKHLFFGVRFACFWAFCREKEVSVLMWPLAYLAIALTLSYQRQPFSL